MTNKQSSNGTFKCYVTQMGGGGVGCDRFVTKSVTRFTVIVLCGGPISRKNVYVIVEWPLNVSIVYTDPLFVTYITTCVHYLSY